MTATVLLAESHLCVHTGPEQAAVTLDVYGATLAPTTAPKPMP